MMAPDFSIDRADESGKISLSSYRGQKPVWVNIWATWCPPCRGEMPEMEKIWGQYKDQVEILGIDFQESPQQVQEFVKNNGYSWTFALDRDTAVGRAYQATGIHTHAFVDKTGVVRYIIRGGLSRDMMMQGLASVGVK
jgi:thiol-disulfide isomerase/thioredoxin